MLQMKMKKKKACGELSCNSERKLKVVIKNRLSAGQQKKNCWLTLIDTLAGDKGREGLGQWMIGNRQECTNGSNIIE
jgi:hypothetical protein